MALGGSLALSACNSREWSEELASSANSPTAQAAATAAGADQSPTTTGSLTGDEAAESPTQTWEGAAQEKGAAPDSQLTITDVRSGWHEDEGYDRVVVEFAGQGTPGWMAPQWVDQATTPGKGDPISIEGQYILVITGTGAAAVPDAQTEYSGPTDITVDGTGIRAAHIDAPFEGEYQIVLGTDTQDFRIFTLDSPTRLVIDVLRNE
ncbi:hypothetical protein ACSL103130_00475 [Actinomyces slackii]|uniref:AMIN-like domain-containing protein n=1 Tax=Actinomyces slackii TaxID=52774 RepID=A0A3S4SPQ1_9ACTO|nr:hypothetical protein [Actinomyces slackii]VEG74901.1 Uncharacterised protein [Actinomyces slackii]